MIDRERGSSIPAKGRIYCFFFGDLTFLGRPGIFLKKMVGRTRSVGGLRRVTIYFGVETSVDLSLSMSFEIVAASDLGPPPGKRFRADRDDEGGLDALTVNDDVIECAGLLGDVKLAFGLPDHAKFKQAGEAVRAYGNSKKIMDEADTFFVNKHAVKRSEYNDSVNVISTLIRILLDWDYKHNYDDSELTHDDRVRLFRILWKGDDFDLWEWVRDQDPQILREIHSDREQNISGLFVPGSVFRYIRGYQKIQIRGEELLLQRIRAFDARLKWELKNQQYLSSEQIQLIDNLAIWVDTGEFDEWGEEISWRRQAKSFCDILFCALQSPDARVKGITESVIAVLQEENYRPNWIRRDENHSRPKRYKTREPPLVRYDGKNHDEYQDYLERATAYLRSPTQDRPEWVGGEFFEREIFFHDMERKNYSVDYMRQRFAERYRETLEVDYDFLIEQGVLVATDA